MIRSSRSIPTGPGSRGGRWHLSAFRVAYWRMWRRLHPDYRERDNRRRAEAKHRLQLVRDRQYVDELAA